MELLVASSCGATRAAGAPPSPRSWSPPRPHRHDDHLQLLRDLHGRHAMKASEGLTTQHAMETDTVGI